LVLCQKQGYLDDEVIDRIQNSIDKGVKDGSSEIDSETLDDINQMLKLNFQNIKEVSEENE
jgi:hypothetical protein